MKISNKGIELIKRHEGLVLKAYRCPADKWTIGYGHTLNVKSTDVINKEQAEYFLRQDVKSAESDVNREKLNLTQNQFDALVSFVFNLGGGNFKKWTLLRKVKANPNDPTIRAEFERWIYAGGKVLNGLVKRRKEEADLYFTL